MGKRKNLPVTPNIPVPKCDYDLSTGKVCRLEAVVAVMPSGSKSLIWLCNNHLRPWLTDHNLNLDDVL